MPIDPVKIPQNVYIEDRIVGPLTLRQTLIMAGGGGVSYTLYAMLNKTLGHLSLVGTVFVWIPAALAAIFALVRINDLSLLRICLLFIEKMQKPTVRTWVPRRGIVINIHTASAAVKQQEEKRQKELVLESQTQTKIEELSTTVDQAFEQEQKKGTEETEDIHSSVPPALSGTEGSVASVTSVSSDTTSHFPVDPSRVHVDRGDSTASHQLSDLSIFRDIFSHP